MKHTALCIGLILAAFLQATPPALADKAATDAKAAKPKDKGPKPDVVFDGKDRELKQWRFKKGKQPKGFWTVGSARLDPDNPREYTVSPKGNELINAKGHGVDMYSTYRHGDAIIKLEVMVPQRSNSGIYVHGEYEIQVLDSFGRDAKPGKGDMGAIYGAAPPTKPKYKKPGEWSTYEIHFLAPKFGPGGKKTANAKLVKVILNGRLIHENVEMTGPTPGGVDRKEKPLGPILFQGNHGPVAYRNITVMPMERLKAAKKGS